MISQLNEIFKDNKDLKVIEKFLNIVTFKMLRSSVEEKSSNTLTFVNYVDDVEYYVPLEQANRILDYCYCEYFFKTILSGSAFYNKVKQVSLDLEIEPFIFDLFFRSLFFAIKTTFNCKTKNSESYNSNLVYEMVHRSYYESFDEFPKNIDLADYSKKADLMLKSLKKKNIICYKNNDITQDPTLQSYFHISCDTFKFYSEKDTQFYSEFESFSQMFELIDLKIFLRNYHCFYTNLLAKLDKSIHMIILICFKDVRFYNNELSDNSYITKLNKAKREFRNKNTIIIKNDA